MDGWIVTRFNIARASVDIHSMSTTPPPSPRQGDIDIYVSGAQERGHQRRVHGFHLIPTRSLFSQPGASPGLLVVVGASRQCQIRSEHVRLRAQLRDAVVRINPPSLSTSYYV